MHLPKFRSSMRAAALPAALAAVLLATGCGGGGGSKSNTSATRSAPVAASVGDLQDLAASVKHPVYWAGTRKGFTYELTETSDGNIFIRYLPSGVRVGDTRPAYLTVGTYPQASAYSNIKAALKRTGARRVPAPGGGLAVQNVSRSPSVYLAYPNSSLLMEVFDPSAKTARAIVRAGTVRPLG